jgi:hypothetical protein
VRGQQGAAGRGGRGDLHVRSFPRMFVCVSWPPRRKRTLLLSPFLCAPTIVSLFRFSALRCRRFGRPEDLIFVSARFCASARSKAAAAEAAEAAAAPACSVSAYVGRGDQEEVGLRAGGGRDALGNALERGAGEERRHDNARFLGGQSPHFERRWRDRAHCPAQTPFVRLEREGREHARTRARPHHGRRVLVVWEGKCVPTDFLRPQFHLRSRRTPVLLL